MAVNPQRAPEPVRWELVTNDELIRRSGAKPIDDVDAMARPDLFESDEEVEEFLAFVRELRAADH